MMRVLVTGIEGFVGSHLAEFLLGLPDLEIHGTVLDPLAIGNIEHVKSRIHLHQIDITDPLRVKRLFAEIHPDRVIHLAGQAFVPSSLHDPVATFTANIFGGITILEGARLQSRLDGIDERVLVVSTGEVYGRVESSSLPIAESAPVNPNNPYAASKASLDFIAQQYRQSFGVNVIVVRPFNHAGPRQNPSFVCSDFGRQFAEIAAGKRAPRIRVGNIDVRRDFTDVRDVVRAYWALIDANTNEHCVYNVCSGKAIQIREILDILQRVSGITVDVVSEEHRMRSYDIPLVIGSHQRLNKTTGWSPQVPFTQTVENTFAYWQRETSSSQ